MQKMEVVIVEGVNPDVTTPGGTRTYILNLIKMLRKEDVNVSLIGISNPDYVHNGEYSFVPVVKSQKVSGYKFLFNLFLKAPFLDIPESAILHFHRVDRALPFLLFFRNNPKVLTIHGMNYKWEWIRNKGIIVGCIFMIIIKLVNKKMDKIILVDEASKKFCKIPDNKVIVIPVGIDTEKFKPMDKTALREKYKFNKNDKVILYVGRFKKEKRLDLLIKAFIKVKKEIPNCKLVLVGVGSEKQNLSKLVNDLKLRNVQFMNTVEHDEIPMIMNCADVFALCSLYEGMPTVVLEALACGVPVVSTDVGDVHKVVHDNETGYIVKSRTIDAIASKLIEVLTNCYNMKENCVKMTQEYSWEKIAEQIKEVYNEVLEKN
jgi:glycosyltransferase involved in cell wall biosynthesis